MPTVTMIGGGQLARMTHQSAIALGQCLRVLAGSADEPAAQVSANVVLGSHDDLEALRAAAEGAVALGMVPGDESEFVTVDPHTLAVLSS